MVILGDSIKEFLSIKIKSRHDSYTDQMSRIVVTKVFIVASVIMGIIWFHNENTCIPPLDSKLPEQFIHKGCWIKGFYIYPHLANHMTSSVYYGIPTDLNSNGIRSNDHSQLCSVEGTYDKRICMPMVKEYFTQYQWMPFCIALLAFVFHFPYIIFRITNTDMSSLRFNLKNNKVEKDDIVLTYFNRKINSRNRNRGRVFVNYVIKFLYVFNHYFAFAFIDRLLNYKFMNYGNEWVIWAIQNSTISTDFNIRESPTPGNAMLPTFGICELYDLRKDSVKTYVNKATVICEISSHVLYQYAFVVIWFTLVFSTVISFLGMILLIGRHTYLLYKVKWKNDSKNIYCYLTIRECEYLDFIRHRDLVIYKGVLTSLQESIEDQSTIPLTYTGTEIEQKNALKERPPLRHLNSILDSDL